MTTILCDRCGEPSTSTSGSVIRQRLVCEWNGATVPLDVRVSFVNDHLPHRPPDLCAACQVAVLEAVVAALREAV